MLESPRLPARFLSDGYTFLLLFCVWCLLSNQNAFCLFFFVQEMSNKEIELTYKLKVLQQELEQEEASHKATRGLLADKSKIKVTIEGAKSESMKGKVCFTRSIGSESKD